MDQNQNRSYPMVHPATFASNPLIQWLSDDPVWTVSDDQKRPVDAHSLLRDGYVENAYFEDNNPLTTLKALDADNRLEAVNRAYRLHARDNNVIAIDVEPEAPDDMKAAVMQFPAHYTELSKNGGVHLIIRVPDDLITDENRYMFEDLAVFKEPREKGDKRPAHYEVMFNDHFITFTKRMDTQKPSADFENNTADKERLKGFLNVITKLDAEKKAEREHRKKFRIDIITENMSDEKKKDIDTFIGMRSFDGPKLRAGEFTPDDYGNDISRYESAVASLLAGQSLRMRKLSLDTISYREIAMRLKDADLVYGIYLMMQDIIPYRDKHDEERDDMPWLMYVAKNSYEYVKSQQNMKNKK